MEYVSDTMALVRRLNAYAYGPDCPEELASRLQSIPGVQADVITQGAQILYAHFDLLNGEGKEVMGLMFNYAVNQHWTAFNEQNGSAQIVALVEGTLDQADVPEPKTQYRQGGVDWREPAPAPTADATA